MTLTLPTFLDALDGGLSKCDGTLTSAVMRGLIREARSAIAPKPTPALGWSDWLEWAGGPCPLPRDAVFQLHGCDTVFHGTRIGNWSNITRFRYREDAPGGWIERGNFIPPAVLWDEACPVRCEWTRGLPVKWGGMARLDAEEWNHFTHIRLLPREKAGEAREMPEGWRIDEYGDLRTRTGWVVLTKRHLHEHGPDTIRRAVDAWLASMKERGNG